MEFHKPITEIIKTRYSCRSFDSSRQIDERSLQQLNDYITAVNEEMQNSTIRFLLAGRQFKKDGSAEQLGTYGKISGASSFIIGIIDKQKQDPLKFGYIFEKIILFATDLGIESCWLGGTFNRSEFEQNTNLRENEFIPIVSPVGNKKENPRLLDRATRVFIGANGRKPWSQLFFENALAKPLKIEDLGDVGTALEMVRLGPSASNKQPWRVVKQDDQYHFFLCRTKNYNLLSYDMQKNDIGIAMCHFELTAKELGLRGSWANKPEVASPNDWEYITTWSAGDA